MTTGSPDGALRLRAVVLVLIFVLLAGVLPLLITWQWDWWEGWVYAVIVIGAFVVSRVFAAQRHPGILAERARGLGGRNVASWDRVLAPIVGFGGILIPIVAGLDVRFAWSPVVALPVRLVALALILAGQALASWALVENAFFSGTVRIQKERGHHVVSTGPYRWMRHPGYSGAILSYLLTPVFLGALWALIPAVPLVMVFVVRTGLEDATLRRELAGYGDYAARVRYRLLPGVW